MVYVEAVAFRIDLPEKPGASDGIDAFADRPAVFKHEGIDIDHADRVIEAFQLAINERSVRPGASPGYVKMIAAGLGGKPAARFDPITIRSGRPLELSAGGRGVVPLVSPNAFDQKPHLNATGRGRDNSY